jgi:arginine-tRNA-protein transferase
MFGRICDDLDKYFIDVPTECPYGMPHTAVYHQSILGPLPDHLMVQLLESGYRRSGNSIYSMNCRQCTACVPIRLRPELFLPDRSQRRVSERNRDITVEVGPLEAADEQIDLCERFLRTRYPGRQNSAREYYGGFFLNAVTNSVEVRYRIDGKLVGVCVVDLGERFLSAVYFYFDPDFADRSPGTMNILYLVELCRRHGLEFLYLGYWIENVSAMAYKARFKPHEILLEDHWQAVERRRGKAAEIAIDAPPAARVATGL